MNKVIITLAVFCLVISCEIENNDIDATPDFSGTYSCEIFILQDNVQIGSSAGHSVRIEKISQDIIEIFPFDNIEELKHIVFAGEMKWNDPTTAGITPFDILNNTISPNDGNTVEIIVNQDGTVEYSVNSAPVFIEGFIMNHPIITFTHNGGFKDVEHYVYATFKIMQGSETYEVYLFSD
jgi:hypothetical protein